MSKSEMQELIDRIEAFSNSSEFAALDPDTRMELAADTSRLLRQASGGVDAAERLQSARDVVTKYDIP